MTLRGVLCLCLVLTLGACEGGSVGTDGERPPPFSVRTPEASPTASTGPVIGLVGSMTGDDRWRGEDAFEGADLAVHVLNQRREAGTLPFQLVTLDDGGDAQVAADLTQQLAEDPRTVGVVYAGPTEGLPQAEPALQSSGIPAVICYGDLYSARLLRQHIFQVAPPLLWQARRQAAYVARDRRYRRVGVLALEGLDGDTAVRSVRQALDQEDLQRPVVQRVVDVAGIGAALQTLERRRVEALVVHGHPRFLPAVTAALLERGASYRSTDAARTVSARRVIRRRERRSGNLRPWRPQVISFDLGISDRGEPRHPAGTVASETYGRGTHYLPLPSLDRFRASFENWWGSEPLGLEQRAYEAASVIGWAARRTSPGDDVAVTLERLDGARFSSLDVRFGPDDHISVDPQTVGLWVIPRADLRMAGSDRLPDGMRWVPLGRGFSTNGRRSDILPQDWEHLFRSPPPRRGPGPLIWTGRFGVVTRRNDPVH